MLFLIQLLRSPNPLLISLLDYGVPSLLFRLLQPKKSSLLHKSIKTNKLKTNHPLKNSKRSMERSNKKGNKLS